jgi:hypothetical protein
MPKVTKGGEWKKYFDEGYINRFIFRTYYMCYIFATYHFKVMGAISGD